MSLAIAGGNIDIIQLLEHSNIHPVDADINDSIPFHHQEIFDWLVEQFPEKLNDEEISSACVENEFVHGIFMISKLSPRLSLKSSSKYGFISLTKLLITNFDIDARDSLTLACKLEYIDLVKLLLSIPSFDVNGNHVNYYFLESHSLMRFSREILKL